MGTDQKEQKKLEPKRNDTLRALANFSQIGITIVATLLVGVLLGKFLDGLLGTTPWLLLLFSLLGIGAAFMGLLRLPQDKE